MNDTDRRTDQDDFESFENLDDGMGMPEDDGHAIDDAEFHDIQDDVDADVFGDDLPEQDRPAKKTNWFNIGVAVVAIVVAGGLVWMKLGPQILGGGDVPPMATNAPGTMTGADLANFSPQQSQNAAQAAVQSKDAPNAQGGLLGNPDQLAGLGKGKAPDSPAPSSGPITDPFAALASGQPAAAPSAPVEASVPMPAPISAAPEPVIASEALPVAKEAAVIDPLPAPVSTSNDTALKGQVDALSQRMDALDAKISSISAAPQASDARLNAIQTSLQRLESRLDSMGNNRPAVREATIREPQNDEMAAPRRAATPKKTVTKAKTKAPASQFDEPYRPSYSGGVNATQASLDVKPAKGAGGWALKGAQPGRAIIGQASGDIREVGVGDTVPGLGEVTGIATVNGRWVVQGTQGRLAQ